MADRGPSFIDDRRGDGACRGVASRRAGHHRHPRRHGQRRRTASCPAPPSRSARSTEAHQPAYADRRDRQLHGAVPGPRHLHRRSQGAGLQEVGPRGDRPAGEPAGPRRRHARGRRHRGDHHRGRGSAAAAHRFLRGRHGDRGAGDQGAAAQRPQLRDAGLPVARHHPGAGRREPVRAPAPSTRAAPRTSTRSATRPTPTPG